MEAPVTTPAKASRHSRRIRTVLVATVVLAAVAAILGSCKGHAALSQAAVASEAPVASEAAASPTPAGSILLSLSGTGPRTSDEFHSSGASVEVSYDYTCAQEGNFTVNFYGTNGSPVLPDIIADEYGTTGAASTVENLNGVTGPFTVEVVSECDWTVKVSGTP
jgi:hypothetical protein